MATWQAGLWGLLGSGLIEGWDLYAAIHAARGFPWKRRDRLKLLPYLVAVAIRLGVGAALAAVYAASGQIAGAIGAVTVGIAAPKILEQLARRAPAAVEVPGTRSTGRSTGTQPRTGPAEAALEEGAVDAH
ncbi:hypothetical protein DR950_01755 [Kitasatospora xanthocidica]|uniref:Uncharacterized protein n=1 Tax=Kitasatospora xanthocidica TaxID=83382 RepID=A0A372ZLD6_9ACTN|nr:hypothetical protein [Kitasatospora xanthocidica]RGD56683.1 hypothetical protein DR950_01755 [Kitasatospora xanthocidica]